MPPVNKPAAADKSEKETKAPSPFVVLRPLDPAKLVAEPVAEGEAPAVAKPAFEQVGEYTSKTSKGAIALAIGEHGGGSYVAIPARSFVVRSAEPVAAPRLNWK